MRIDGYCTLGVDREYDFTTERLLAALDQAGVDKAVIAPPPRYAAVLNAVGNDAVCAAATAHPDRFIATCTATPWLGDEAAAELRRAIGNGAQLVVIDPVTQGAGLGDDLWDPVLAAAEALRVPVYVHTGGYQFGTPAQLGLSAARFPDVRFIMGHGGSTDYKLDAVEVARSCANVVVEVSLARPVGALSFVADLAPGTVIMGSAAPLNDLVFEWQETLCLVDEGEHPDFYAGTLLSLLTADG